ncbi:hypothetical protein U1Q18_025264 [Sarracenia purpurea var. burkii]
MNMEKIWWRPRTLRARTISQRELNRGWSIPLLLQGKKWKLVKAKRIKDQELNSIQTKTRSLNLKRQREWCVAVTCEWDQSEEGLNVDITCQGVISDVDEEGSKCSEENEVIEEVSEDGTKSGPKASSSKEAHQVFDGMPQMAFGSPTR